MADTDPWESPSPAEAATREDVAAANVVPRLLNYAGGWSRTAIRNRMPTEDELRLLLSGGKSYTPFKTPSDLLNNSAETRVENTKRALTGDAPSFSQELGPYAGFAADVLTDPTSDAASFGRAIPATKALLRRAPSVWASLMDKVGEAAQKWPLRSAFDEGVDVGGKMLPSQGAANVGVRGVTQKGLARSFLDKKDALSSELDNTISTLADIGAEIQPKHMLANAQAKISDLSKSPVNRSATNAAQRVFDEYRGGVARPDVTIVDDLGTKKVAQPMQFPDQAPGIPAEDYYIHKQPIKKNSKFNAASEDRAGSEAKAQIYRAANEGLMEDVADALDANGMPRAASTFRAKNKTLGALITGTPNAESILSKKLGLMAPAVGFGTGLLLGGDNWTSRLETAALMAAATKGIPAVGRGVRNIGTYYGPALRELSLQGSRIPGSQFGDAAVNQLLLRSLGGGKDYPVTKAPEKKDPWEE